MIIVIKNNRIGFHKYNEGKNIFEDINMIKEWFKENRDKMHEIDLKEKYEKEFDNFFSNLKKEKFIKKD